MPSSEKHSEGSLANMDGSSNRVQTCQARLANGYLVAIFAKYKVGSKWFEYQLPCPKKRGQSGRFECPTPCCQLPVSTFFDVQDDDMKCIYIYICKMLQTHKRKKPSSFAALKSIRVVQWQADSFSFHTTALNRKSWMLACLQSKSSEAPSNGHMKALWKSI